MRYALTTLGLLAIGAVVWLVFGAGLKSDPQPESSRVTTARAESTEPAEGPAETSNPSSDATARTELSLATTTDASDTGDASESAADTIEGSVVVVDDEGVEHVAESGTFDTLLWTGNQGTSGATVQVSEGRFVMDRPTGDRIEVRDLLLGDRPVVLEEKSFELPVDSLVLRGKWYAPTTLRVVDAESRLDLRDVTVIRTSDWKEDDAIHPGSYDAQHLLAERAASPLSLLRPKSFFSDTLRVWVGAAGYAWQATLLDFAAGGEHSVALEPGADLTVHLQGDLTVVDKRPRPQVRVRRADPADPAWTLDEWLDRWRASESSEYPSGRKPTEEEARAQHARMVERARAEPGEVILFGRVQSDGPMRWRGLPSGEFVVSIEVGDHWDKPLVLGSAPVTLRVGQETQATVTLAPRPAATDRVPLAGTLFLPPEWGDLKWSLRLEPQDLPGATNADDVTIRLGDMTPVAGSPGLYRWDAKRVHPGAYEVTIHAIEYQEFIDTGPNGRTDVAITIAPPADVTVRLLDRATGLALPGVNLLWYCKRPEQSSGGGLDNAEWDEASQTYRFRAPAMAVELAVFDDAFAADDFDVLYLKPGPNTFTFHAGRVLCVRLEVREGGRLVELPHEWFWALKVAAVGGPGTGRPGSASDTHGTIRFTEPGTYEIAATELPGYAPIDPFRIEVAAGETITHVLEVTHAQR